MTEPVWIEMRVGNGPYRKISIEQLEKLPRLFADEFEKELEVVGERMLAKLRDLYERVIRGRPRYEKGRFEGNLKNVVMQAMGLRFRIRQSRNACGGFWDRKTASQPLRDPGRGVWPKR